MLSIQIKNTGRSIEVESGSSLLSISEEQDLKIMYGCRQGACGSCLIRVEDFPEALSPAEEDEQDFLKRLNAGPNDRLACQCVVNGNVTLDVDPPVLKEEASRESAGFLFLSHRGLSFIDDLLDRAKSHGYEGYVLVSKPAPENQHRIPHIQSISQWFQSTEEASLSWEEVRAAILSLRKQGKRILGCISVWEGYREWMARANQLLGVSDLSVNQLSLILDKHRLRKFLFENQLSEVNSQLIDASNFNALRSGDKAVFIKPRRGLASFGAFRLRPEMTYEQLQALQSEILEDPEYRDVLSVYQGAFVSEDLIQGTEVSFELIVHRSKPFVIAIHEKTEVEDTGITTLESACVSPPATLTDSELAQGELFLEKVFHAIGIQTGCFHVEAKYDHGRWELIEINPRVGGALINTSTQFITQGPCLLDLWLSLYEPCKSDRLHDDLLKLKWNAPMSGGDRPETFFRVYFGKPGSRISKIQSIQPGNDHPAPDSVRIFAREGDQLPRSSREIFLGQALWTSKSGSIRPRLKEYLKNSEHSIQVEYFEPLTQAPEKDSSSLLLNTGGAKAV